VASRIHDAGIPVMLITTDPAVVAAPGIEVQPANDPGPPMETTENILDLIGNTPLLALHRTGRDLTCRLLAKLEYLNPGGSVKDRPQWPWSRRRSEMACLCPVERSSSRRRATQA